ncbi:MAG: hypothetical protein IT555_18180 [Acetobacteraceae bacterium]|nr:hypothetical protein [Acetobacteraceae bacterium]
MAKVPFNHANKPAGHYYNPNRVASSQFPLPTGSWTAPTYYEIGYTAKFIGALGGQDVTIRERHFDPQTHLQISEAPRVIKEQNNEYVIDRPPGTYISVQNASGFPLDGDKDSG